jgi:hypothetical protein
LPEKDKTIKQKGRIESRGLKYSQLSYKHLKVIEVYKISRYENLEVAGVSTASISTLQLRINFGELKGTALLFNLFAP